MARQQREYSQELYEEFDVFSVQIKSTLDHLVQIMRPILGRNKWTMYSFGDKGERVLASLQRNTSKHYAGHVRMMEHQLFNETNKRWLTGIIDARDRVNHGMAGGMKIEPFAVYRDAAGTVHLPMWNHEQRLGASMAIVWDNLFRYVEDFIVLAINFRLRHGRVRRASRPQCVAGKRARRFRAASTVRCDPPAWRCPRWSGAP